MFCTICSYCGNCKRKMSDEAEWRFPQGINDEDSLANWTWDEVLKAEQSEKQSACQENSPDKA